MQNGGHAHRPTLYAWLAQHSDFAEQFAAAWEARPEMGLTPLGRPKGYSPALASAISERVGAGQALHWICSTKNMPSVETVYGWRKRYDDFATQFARAEDIQARMLAEELIDIADDPALAADDKKVRFNVRKWLASKASPRKYGERAQPEPECLVQSPSDEELARQLKELVTRYVASEGLKLVPVDAVVTLPGGAPAEVSPDDEDEGQIGITGLE